MQIRVMPYPAKRKVKRSDLGKTLRVCCTLYIPSNRETTARPGMAIILVGLSFLNRGDLLGRGRYIVCASTTESRDYTERKERSLESGRGCVCRSLTENHRP